MGLRKEGGTSSHRANTPLRELADIHRSVDKAFKALDAVG
jgi:hypothetical protein